MLGCARGRTKSCGDGWTVKWLRSGWPSRPCRLGHEGVTVSDVITMLLSMLCVLLPIGVTVAIMSSDCQRPYEQRAGDEVGTVGHGGLARCPAGDEQEQCGDSAQENSEAQSEDEHPGVEPSQPEADHRAEFDVSQPQAGAEVRQGQADAAHRQCAERCGEGGVSPVGIQHDGDHAARG